LQDEIALQILKTLTGQLLGRGTDHTGAKGTKNIKAYLKWLKAHTLASRNEVDNRLARQMSEEAISLDPEFALAYAQLGINSFNEVMNGWSKSPRKDLEKAFELAQKSISPDQSLALPHFLLGWIYFLKGDHEKAIAKSRRAIALSPNNSDVYGSLGNILAWADRPEDAISVIKKASRLNPIPTWRQLVFSGNAYYIAGRYEEALAYFKRLQEKDPDNLWAYITPASIYGQLGREKEARAAAKELLRLNPKFSIKHWEKMGAFSKKRETWDQWIDGLRKAGLPE